MKCTKKIIFLTSASPLQTICPGSWYLYLMSQKNQSVPQRELVFHPQIYFPFLIWWQAHPSFHARNWRVTLDPSFHIPLIRASLRPAYSASDSFIINPFLQISTPVAIIQCFVISHWIIVRLSGWLAYLPSVKFNLQLIAGGTLLLKCKSTNARLWKPLPG